MSNCQQSQIVNNVKLSTMSNCQNVKLSKCQIVNNVKLSNFQIVKLSQYQMSCIIRVCRLTQRIDCVVIFSIFCMISHCLWQVQLSVNCYYFNEISTTPQKLLVIIFQRSTGPCFGPTNTNHAKKYKHCQRHNGPRILSPKLELSLKPKRMQIPIQHFKHSTAPW